MTNDLKADLHDLVDQWNVEARARQLDGMGPSADTLRDCGDDLQRILHRNSRPAGGTPTAPDYCGH